MTDKTQDKPFLPLGQYDWPKLPTEDRLRLAFARLKAEIFRSSDAEGPAVAADRLQGIAAERLDRIAAPPAYGRVLDEMSLTLTSWLDGSGDAARTKLVVMPPCDDRGIVRSWAMQHGLTCLEAPDREDLLGEPAPAMPYLDGEGVLVIANLEHWFLRHRNGLRAVRLLLAAISRTERRCLIGCNSWAWSYLSSAIDANLQLPEGMTFQAFDKVRLHDWFCNLSAGPQTGVATFRISDSGADVFATNDNDELQSDFFQKLAAHSLGIPWVAWNLWRRSLRETRETDPDAENGDTTPDPEDDDDTIWIAAVEEFTLPADHRQPALLVLQSLLIHGPLSVAQLGLTLPFVSQTNMVESLIGAGFLRLEGGFLSCVSAAYPTIRRELANAGYAMDRV